MARRGKKYKNIKKLQPTTALKLEEALRAVKKLSYSKFDGSVELNLMMKLPKDKDPKSLKGSVSLPHSAGAVDVKIAVFTSKEREVEAKKAGADIVDLEKLTADIKAGKIEFDVAIASPDVMPQIAALGKELGPRGLMPNPKTGTVTDDLESAIKEYKQGKMTFKADALGNMSFKAGKVSQGEAELTENIWACVNAAADILGKNPEQAVQRVHIAPSMGPSVEVEMVYA